MVHFTQEGGDISSEMFSPPSPLGWSSEGVPKTLNNIVFSFSATSSFARGAFSQVFNNYCARRSLLFFFHNYGWLCGNVGWFGIQEGQFVIVQGGKFL